MDDLFVMIEVGGRGAVGKGMLGYVIFSKEDGKNKEEEKSTVKWEGKTQKEYKKECKET